jgi:CRISPR/Cas system-associated exonuclease Cas4 (RecB family)
VLGLEYDKIYTVSAVDSVFVAVDGSDSPVWYFDRFAIEEQKSYVIVRNGSELQTREIYTDREAAEEHIMRKLLDLAEFELCELVPISKRVLAPPQPIYAIERLDT